MDILPKRVKKSSLYFEPLKIFIFLLLSVPSSNLLAAVTPSGAFTTRIPIKLPAGVSPIAPDLALTYNSNSANGLAGKGWGLSGLSSITRTPGARPIEYKFDAYVHSGLGELVLNNSTSYSPKNENFVTFSPKGFCGVTSFVNTTVSAGPCQWTATDKKGITYFYGNSPDSRIEAVGKNDGVRVWALQRVQDLNGNSYRITYNEDTDNGDFYPTSIIFEGVAPVTVRFSYEPRVITKNEKYPQNARVSTRLRLAQIDVEREPDSADIRSYRLSYNTQANCAASKRDTTQDLLGCFAEYSANGTLLNTQKFTWTRNADSSKMVTSNAGSLVPQGWHIGATGDFDGNGYTDFIAYQAGRTNQVTGISRLYRRVILGGSLTTYQSISLNPQIPLNHIIAATGDFNGDGKTDFISYRVYNGGIASLVGSALGSSQLIHLSNPSGDGTFTTKALNPLIDDFFRVFSTGDFDGDGRTDFIAAAIIWDHTTTKINPNLQKIYLSTGDGSFSARNLNPSLPPTSIIGAVGDFNGDGNDDLIAYQVPNTGNNACNRASSGQSRLVYLSLGNGAFKSSIMGSPITAPGLSANKTISAVGDYNGDGLTDYITHRTEIANCRKVTGDGSVYYAKGDGKFFQAFLFPSPPPNYMMTGVGDLNGDGSSDFIAFNVGSSPQSNGNRVVGDPSASYATGLAFYSTPKIWHLVDLPAIELGLAFFDIKPISLRVDSSILVAGNIFGKGTVDLLSVQVDREGKSLNIGNRYLSSDAQEKPSLLKSIDNGLMGTTDITYKSATQIPNVIQPARTSCGGGTEVGYFKACGNASSLPRILVTQVSKGDGRLSPSGKAARLTKTYKYTNARYYPGTYLNRANLGFETMTVASFGGDVNNLFQKPGEILQTTFYQNKRFEGRVKSTRKTWSQSSPAEEVIEKRFFYESITPRNNRAARFVRITSLIEETFFETGSASFPKFTNKTVTDFTYEANRGFTAGNIIKKNVSSPGLPSVETLTTYTNTSAIIGRVDSVETVSKGNRLTYQTMAYENDNSNKPSNVCDWLDTNNSMICTNFVYNSNGSLKSSEDLRGGTIYFEYASPFTEFLPTKTTNPLGHVTTTEYDKFGRIAQVTDPNGSVTTSTSDEFGRPDVTSTPDGVTTKNLYLDYGTQLQRNVMTVSNLHGIDESGNVSTSLSVTTHSLFDGGGFVYKTSNKSDKGDWISVQNTKDLLWRFEKTSNPYFEADPLSDAPQALDWTTTLYNPEGKLAGVIRPDGATSQVRYQYLTNKLITSRVDFEGNLSGSHADAFGRNTLIINGSSSVFYRYDPLSRPISVSVDGGPKNNFVTNITYDSFGRQTSITEPNTGTTQFVYDDLLNSRTTIYENGKTVSVLNDLLGRPRIRFAGGSGSNAFYSYDSASTNGIGRLSGVVSGGGIATFQYDEMGNLTRKGLFIDNKAFPINYVYSGSRLIQTKYPDGSIVDSYTTQNGNPYSMALNGVEMAFWGTNYDKFGNNTQLNNGSHIFAEYRYDPLLSQMINRKVSNSADSSQIWQDLDYRYYDQGNLSDIVDNRSDKFFNQIYTDATESFFYDTSYRLKTATGIYGTRQYDYDEIGNMVNKAGKNLTYGLKTNQPVFSNNSDFSASYDVNGNMKQKRLNTVDSTYTYNSMNQLTRINSNGQMSNFVYDSTGQRVKKSHRASNGDITTTLYIDKGFEVTTKADGSKDYTLNFFGNGSLLSSWTHDANLIVDTNATRLPASMKYFISNHLGSTISVINDSGTQISRTAYLPYGDHRITGEEATHHKFTGQELDGESDLYYYNARYYDPEIGSFITADTIVPDPTDSQSFNRYSYVRNNPIMRIDPSGNSDASVNDPFGIADISSSNGLRPSSPGNFANDPFGLNSINNSISSGGSFGNDNISTFSSGGFNAPGQFFGSFGGDLGISFNGVDDSLQSMLTLSGLVNTGTMAANLKSTFADFPENPLAAQTKAIAFATGRFRVGGELLLGVLDPLGSETSGGFTEGVIASGTIGFLFTTVAEKGPFFTRNIAQSFGPGVLKLGSGPALATSVIIPPLVNGFDISSKTVAAFNLSGFGGGFNSRTFNNEFGQLKGLETFTQVPGLRNSSRFRAVADPINRSVNDAKGVFSNLFLNINNFSMF